MGVTHGVQARVKTAPVVKDRRIPVENTGIFIRFSILKRGQRIPARMNIPNARSTVPDKYLTAGCSGFISVPVMPAMKPMAVNTRLNPAENANA